MGVFGTIVLVVVIYFLGKFIYDSYLTDNTEKMWNKLQEDENYNSLIEELFFLDEKYCKSKASNATITFKIARHIILGRKILEHGILRNVEVLSVSFIDKEIGMPYEDDNWNDGKPFAIVDFNAVNRHGFEKAKELFAKAKLSEDEFKKKMLLNEACNIKLNAIVDVKLGKQIAEMGIANIYGETKVMTNSENETIETIIIRKCEPSMDTINI